MTIVPVAGYHLGQANKKELHGLWHKGMLLMGAIGTLITLICQLFAQPIVHFFVGYNADLAALSVHALRIIALYFLLDGMTVYAGSYFTGLNQGTASLLIAAVKGIISPLVLVWVLQALFGQDGLWLVTPVAEALAMIAAAACILWWWRGAEDRNLGAEAEEAAE